MDSPLDVQQIVSALVFWAAFRMTLWISHGTGVCRRARRRPPRGIKLRAS